MPAKRKRKIKEIGEQPTPEQIGAFEKRSVTHVDDVQTTSQAYVRAQARSAFERLCERGAITDDQLNSIREIAKFLEYQRLGLSMGGASMEARVDCSSRADYLGRETLRMVRIEDAYGEWFRGLPLPRQMFVDMIFEDRQLAAIARRYRRAWVKARQDLCSELDKWPDLMRDAVSRIRHEDMLIAHARLRA